MKDGSNQCGLRGMLSPLGLLRVVNRVAESMSIDATSALTSPTREAPFAAASAHVERRGSVECWEHVILRRTASKYVDARTGGRGHRARTYRLTVNGTRRSTRDDGGDCHMGHALILPAPLSERGGLAGAE